MRPSLALQVHRDAIREIVLRHRVKNVRVFGSVLHGDDSEDSDLDLLVDPRPETTLPRGALVFIHKCSSTPRSHVLRGNAVLDALRPVYVDVARDSRRSAP